MSLPVIFQFATPDPDVCPTTFTEQVAALNELAEGEITTDLKTYVYGSDTPAVEDQDKVWERTDANGRPIGRYVYYDGNWRREYPVGIGTIVMYNGDPGEDFPEDGGRGEVGGMFDGWQLCNGENGAPDLSDKFIVGAKMSDLAVGYPEGSGPWKSAVSGEGLQTGGINEITLNADNTFVPARSGITVGLETTDGVAPSPTGDLYGPNTTYPTTIGAGEDEVVPDAIPVLPPYYALAFIVFKGYA